MVAVALFVTGGCIGLSVYLSLKKDLVDRTPPENILIMNSGAIAEPGSRIELEATRSIALFDGIKKGAAGPLVAAELVSIVNLPTATYFPEGRIIRGIDTHSLDVHQARLLEGVPPAPNTTEVIIGKKLAKKFKLQLGNQLSLPGGAAKISGIFTTNGGPLEDEVWTPRKALEIHLKSQFLSSMTIVADGVNRVPDLLAKINGRKELGVAAATRASLLAAEAGLATILKVVLLLLLLLAAIAISAIAATMSAAILARMPEFAAMVAIGIRRSKLMRMVLLESVLLTVVGTLIGLIIAETVRRTVGTFPVGYPVELSSDIRVPLVGAALGMLVGILGGIAPAIAVRRLDVIQAMR